MSARSRSRVNTGGTNGIESIAAQQIRRPCNRNFFDRTRGPKKERAGRIPEVALEERDSIVCQKGEL